MANTISFYGEDSNEGEPVDHKIPLLKSTKVLILREIHGSKKAAKIWALPKCSMYFFLLCPICANQ